MQKRLLGSESGYIVFTNQSIRNFRHRVTKYLRVLPPRGCSKRSDRQNSVTPMWFRLDLIGREPWRSKGPVGALREQPAMSIFLPRYERILSPEVYEPRTACHRDHFGFFV